MTQQLEVKPFDQYNQLLVSNTHPADWQNPNPDGRYNLLVIGGGSGGLIAATAAAGMGGKVALVEKKLLGGDCLHTGCVPSKTIIRSAKAVGDIRRAADLGVTIKGGEIDVDFRAIMERMRRIRSEISHHDSAERFKNLGIDLFLGSGSFSGPNSFEIDGRTIHFSRAVIATGARAADIPIPGLKESGYINNEGVFELTELPQRLVIIGAGVIGLEMAQSFARFGSQVTVMDITDKIGGLQHDDEISLIRRALERDGVYFCLETQIEKVELANGGKKIHFMHAGEPGTLVADEILLAAGRRPNIEGLGLDAAGIEYTPKGLKVNDLLQTTNPAVYGAGDVAIPAQFTHTADASARIVLQNALFMGRKKYSDLVIPWAVYTDPEIAHVGMTDYEAEAAGIEVDTFQIDVQETDRGRTDGEEGFIKVYVKKGSSKIVGATIIARHAGEMISEVTAAMVGNLGMNKLAQTIHPYPVQAELIKKAADAWNRTRFTPTVAKLFKTWLSWRR